MTLNAMEGHVDAEFKSIDVDAIQPSSSDSAPSESSESATKRRAWREKNEDDDYDGVPFPGRLPETNEQDFAPLKKAHTLTLGILKLRPDDDTDPTDWWFASTAIPLIAATFSPMANLLSIAALVVYWRNNVTVNDPETYMETSVGYADPRWCTDLNIASLVCGFVGNLFLLFNFTRRVRYIVALPLTIFLFYAAAGILIAITVSMHLYVPPVSPGQIYSQGYWHAVIAACLYMFNSMILMANMAGYFLGHYPQHFTLTDEQRNLILQTMLFFFWLGIGGLIFCKTEGWSYPDALYFCDVTILTIGFGDFYATNDLGRGLVFPYSVGGTIILGLMVSSIHKFAGELSKDKVLRQHVENKRVNTLSRAVTEIEEEKRRDDLERQLSSARKHGRKPTISRPIPNPQIQEDLDRMAGKEKQIGFGDMPKKEDLQNADELEPQPHQFFSSKAGKGRLHRTLTFLAMPVHHVTKQLSKRQKAIVMREEKDRFDAMRSIQHNARTFKKWYSLAISVVMFALLWCVGAIVFWQVEGPTQQLSYFQALYFCYVSLLTIGYGDLSPRSNAGKPFFIVWSLIAVPTMTILISDMGDTVIASFKQGTFRLADFTVLPKQGLWRELYLRHPWIWNILRRLAEKGHRKKGLPVGPSEEEEEKEEQKKLAELAEEDLSEAVLTKRLAVAIRKTADDLAHHPGKRYEYEDWAEFTRLIRFTKMDREELEYDEEKDGVIEWDWLDENSPMLSEQSESEWVLDRLCESLLRLLKKNKLGGSEADTDKSLGDWVFSRSTTTDKEESIDPLAAVANGGAVKEPEIDPRKEKRQRATGAEKILTFFTGERRGATAYTDAGPLWSSRGHDKQKAKRRRSSAGIRRGPFARLHHHGHATGAVGGGRGGAGTRTLKARILAGSRG